MLRILIIIPFHAIIHKTAGLTDLVYYRDSVFYGVSVFDTYRTGLTGQFLKTVHLYNVYNACIISFFALYLMRDEDD